MDVPFITYAYCYKTRGRFVLASVLSSPDECNASCPLPTPTPLATAEGVDALQPLRLFGDGDRLRVLGTVPDRRRLGSPSALRDVTSALRPPEEGPRSRSIAVGNSSPLPDRYNGEGDGVGRGDVAGGVLATTAEGVVVEGVESAPGDPIRFCSCSRMLFARAVACPAPSSS